MHTQENVQCELGCFVLLLIASVMEKRKYEQTATLPWQRDLVSLHDCTPGIQRRSNSIHWCVDAHVYRRYYT